jgi:hypothetical protein
MQELVHIEVGQQDNDGKGDLLRRGMAKVNANFAKVQAGVDAIELIAVGAKEQAAAAQIVADAAVPTSQKGMAGGVAPLDGTGKVPSVHLDDFVHSDEKGASGGVATLGADGKVTPTQLPNAVDAIPMSQRGTAGGVATLDGGGKVPMPQLPSIGPAVGSVAWWPLRRSIPAGQIPADGQTVSRATYPDLAAMVIAGSLPVVTEAQWIGDPLKRASYTLGDGATTIRLPDLNGLSDGSIGRVFLSGDGALSGGANGLIQRDALQNIAGSLDIGWGRNIARMVANPSGNTTGPFRSVVDGGNGYLVEGSQRIASDYASSYTFDASRVARTATETRPTNVAGCFVIQAFGVVTNPGSVDAAQLATNLAATDARVQTIDSGFGSLQSKVLGVGQSLVDVTASRSLATVYTNSTGRPIYIYVYCISTAANGYAILTLNEVSAGQTYYPGVSGTLAFGTLVPPGSTYRVNVSSAYLSSWREYR